jgi:hypothetical protein
LYHGFAVVLSIFVPQNWQAELEVQGFGLKLIAC